MFALTTYLKQNVLNTDLRRNIAYTFSRQLAAAVAQLAIVVILARQLGPEGNGQYAIAVLIPSMLANFMSFGIGPATVYFISRGIFPATHVNTENRKIGLIASLAGLAIALPIICLYGEQLFPGVPVQLLGLGLLIFPLSLHLALKTSVLQGLEDFRAYNWCVLVPPYVALISMSAFLLAEHLNSINALACYFLGQCFGVATTSTFLKKSHQKSTATNVGHLQHYVRKAFRYGWKVHIANILGFLNYRADLFLVNLLLNPAATGLYVIAVQIAERLWMLSAAASTVLLPKLSTLHHDPGKRIALTKRSFLIISAATGALACVFAALLSLFLIPLFGAEYSATMGAFLWLLPGIIVTGGSRIQANSIAAAGKPEWNMYAAFAVVTINILGNIALIPLYGIDGAAMATSCAYIANAIIKAHLIEKTIHIIG